MEIAPDGGMVTDTPHPPGKRCSVEMDIEGTHKDPDQHFLPLEVLTHDIIHGNADASLDRDDRLSGRYPFDIDYGAVGRAQ